MVKKRKKGTPLLVGITGGIGSGKSTVSRVFEWLKIPVYYSDERAKLIINENKVVRKQIKSLLGAKSYTQNQYNRSYVASRVFKNKEMLESLNAIVHPAVAQDFKDWVNANKSEDYVLKEAAILFESGAYKEMDKIICVTAPKELRIKRVLKRDKTSRKAILARINNQMDEAEKVSRSQYVIENDEKTLLIPQIVRIHKLIIQSIG